MPFRTSQGYLKHPHGAADITQELGNICALLKRPFTARHLAEMLRFHISLQAESDGLGWSWPQPKAHGFGE